MSLVQLSYYLVCLKFAKHPQELKTTARKICDFVFKYLSITLCFRKVKSAPPRSTDFKILPLSLTIIVLVNCLFVLVLVNTRL